MKKIQLSDFAYRPYANEKLYKKLPKKLVKFVEKNLDNNLFMSKVHNGIDLYAPEEERLSQMEDHVKLLLKGDREFAYGLSIER